MFRVEKMQQKDFAFAVTLANTMDWNMAESDLEFMSKLEPDGCFVLFHGYDPVGMATCISYGKKGWFGNLAVAEEHRKEGAGSFLVKLAVEYLKRKGVETVGLYAYPHLTSFYKKLGFEPNDDFTVYSGKPSNSTRSGDFQNVNRKDIPALIEFDNRCLGWNRRKLLEPVLLDKNNLGFFSRQNVEVAGFVAAKVYREMAEIGPFICRRDLGDVGVDLLKTVLAKLRNLDVYVYAPMEEKAILETLQKAGLKENFRLTRMFLGSAAAQNCVYLPESMERG
jgi:GNAT superfamily N-acetyltransferase